MRRALLPALLALSAAVAACGSGEPLQRSPPPAPEGSVTPAPVAAPSRATPAPEQESETGHICAASETHAALDLLSGRLQMRALPGLIPRNNTPSNIMGAPPSPQLATNARLTRGRATLWVRARELLARSPADLAAVGPATLASMLGIETDELARQEAPVGVRTAFVVAPREPRVVEGVITLRAALVDPGSGHLVFVGVGLQGLEGRLDVADCGARAEEMIASLAAGERTLDVHGGERILGASPTPVRVRLPRGWMAFREDGPDFVVHRMIEVGALGAEAASVGLYLGAYPAGLSGSPGSDVERLLGEDVHIVEQPGPPLTTEALVPIGEGLSAHVWFTGPDERAHEAARAVARTLRVGVGSESAPPR